MAPQLARQSCAEFAFCQDPFVTFAVALHNNCSLLLGNSLPISVYLSLSFSLAGCPQSELFSNQKTKQSKQKGQTLEPLRKP